MMPRRRDIDPTEIPRLLPNLQITELIDGGARIRYRLTGTAIVNAYGADLTGKYFQEPGTAEVPIRRRVRPPIHYGAVERGGS